MFFCFFFTYIKVSKDSKHYQNNNERLKKKCMKDISLSKQEKEKNTIIWS